MSVSNKRIVCAVIMVLFSIAASNSVDAQSCWQCMHGCGGRDAQVCGYRPAQETLAVPQPVEGEAVQPLEKPTNERLRSTAANLRGAAQQLQSTSQIRGSEAAVDVNLLREIARLMRETADILAAAQD